MSVDQEMLQKCVLPVLAGIVVVCLAIEYAWLRNDDSKGQPPSTFRMPSSNLAKLSPALGAKTVVFATQPSGGNLITAAPSPTATGGYTIVFVTTDSYNAHTGDVILEMPNDPGFEIYQWVRTYGKCDQLAVRGSCTPYTMAGYVAQQAIQQVGTGGILSDLSDTSNDLSLGDLIAPLMQQLPLVMAYGKSIAALAANLTLLTNVAKFLLLAVYVEITTTGPNPTQLVVPANDLVTSTQAPQTTGSECPYYPYNCNNCGGNKSPTAAATGSVNTNGICVGLAKYGGWPEDCVCVDPDDAPPDAPYGSMDEIDEAVIFLGSVSANAINPTTSASSAPSQPCNNGARYKEPGTCSDKCPGGKCTPVELEFRKCLGCNNGPEYAYQCTCP